MKKIPITDCSAVILAGGKNSRYGGFHKAFLRIDNEFIIEKDLKLLKSLFQNVMIVANDSGLFGSFGVPVFEDIYENRGPLAGIHSALTHTNTPSVMVFGCDMPFLNSEMILLMYDTFINSGKDYCIPRYKGFIEPLHAFYSRNVLDDLDNHLKNKTDNSVRRFVEDKDVCFMNIESGTEVFFNINSPEDLGIVTK